MPVVAAVENSKRLGEVEVEESEWRQGPLAIVGSIYKGGEDKNEASTELGSASGNHVGYEKKKDGNSHPHKKVSRIRI